MYIYIYIYICIYPCRYQLSGNTKCASLQDIEKQSMDLEKVFYGSNANNSEYTQVVLDVTITDVSLLPRYV